jgi:hypothetical protein
MALQVRRGTNAERLGITPAEGELIFTTDTKQLYVGDGSTAGGITSIAGTIDSLLADTTPQLGGGLDLNNFDITGTGNINITGNIQATGNINLGDGVGSDVLNLGAEISGSIIPNTDSAHNIGSGLKYWNEAWINQLNVNSQITAERIQADIIAEDSTVVFNAATGIVAAEQVSGTFTGNVVGNVTGNVVGNVTGYHTGDVSGSIFADDSTLMIDGINSQFGLVDTPLGLVSRGTGTIDTTATLAFKYTGTLPPGEPLNMILVQQDDQQKFVIQTRPTNTYISHDDNGATGITMYNNFVVHGGLKQKIEPANADFTEPTEALEVLGNIKGTGFVQFGSLTTTERDALTAANGMVIYNTTDNKFQGYENGSWVNLI